MRHMFRWFMAGIALGYLGSRACDPATYQFLRLFLTQVKQAIVSALCGYP